MKDIDWELLRLFGHVARAGSLSGAAERTGISAPTLGRRMLELEAALGRSLFTRLRTGYELTVDGRALFERARAMEVAATSVEAWRGSISEMPIVVVSAGTWMSRYIAEKLPALWTPADDFRLCFKTDDARLDLERREADIGIRNERPDTGNVAGLRSVTVRFAPFCARGFDQITHANWVALGADGARTPSARWMINQPDLWITVWANTPRMLYDLVRGGAGRCVLPCFIGDSDPELVRAGPLIPELDHDMWIVAHDDGRHRREVRLVIDRLAALYQRHAPLFSGERALSSD